MQPLNLDQPVFELASQTARNNWTIRDSFNGLSIHGGIGAGKSSGSARFVALKYLQLGYGGLVLTVKPDEKEEWAEYCRMTGRSDDLIVIEPGGRYRFNFIDYESRNQSGQEAITENIVEVLKTVIRAGEEKSSGKSDDPFWETALDMLMVNAIDLCRLAYGRVTITDLYNVVQSIPKAEERPQSGEEEPKAFQTAFRLAKNKVNLKVDKWFANLSNDVRESYLEDPGHFQQQMTDEIPDVRLMQFLDQFFIDNYIGLSEKTRSIVDFQFSGFLFRLLREPIFSLFCQGQSTVIPEDAFNGKIILLNLPIKLYHKVGRDCQVLFKFIFQRRMEARDVNLHPRPVFLWADEAQHFVHEHDPIFQATARSSRVATVYITQNLPNYYAAMGGGDKAEYRVKSFLGTLATKIFHANAEMETNKYASELVGDGYFEERSDSLTVSQSFSRTRSRSLSIDKLLRPEDFVRLKTGGPLNNFRVEGVIHKQGDVLLNGQNHVKMVFNQHYAPSPVLPTSKLIIP